jgi:hypothetical protein
LTVLEAGRATIEKYRPVCFVEWLKIGKGRLQQFFRPLNYEFCDSGINILAVPAEDAALLTTL